MNAKRFVQNYIRPCVRICGLSVRMSPCRLCVCLFLHMLAHQWLSPAKADEPIILGDGSRLQGRVHAGAGGAQAPKSWLGPEILPAPKLWLAVVLCLSVCLCLFISHKSVFYWSGWTDRAGFWHGGLFRPVPCTLCFKEIQVPSNLRNFTTAYRSSNVLST